MADLRSEHAEQEAPSLQDSPLSTTDPSESRQQQQQQQQQQEETPVSTAEPCGVAQQSKPKADAGQTGDANTVEMQRQSSSTSRPSCCSRAHSHSSSHQAHAHSQSSANSLSMQRTVSVASSASSSSKPRPGLSSRLDSRSTSRNPSFEYRETLNARSKDMDDGSRIINQYRMTDVIGKGSYGTVHRATLADDPSVTFAIKEFGKTRLRKSHRASNMKRGPQRGGAARGGARARGGFVAAHDSMQRERNGGEGQTGNQDLKDPLMLIRHEIAILKKLHHPNVVRLYEVLDDPSKDSLYMVFEHCPDGVVIDVKLHEQVEPLDEDTARSYFVQIMLGMEYLHSNDIVHRDIKPDNILLSDGGRTCKIVDFGVSEMFLKPGDDTMEKSAGSPAFMSPELCTAGHSYYHGRSDDIWSVGVTLYCMVVGHLPFNQDNFFKLYESIKADEPEYPEHLSEDLKDLLSRLLEKNPDKRITIAQMREHAWVTRGGENLIMSTEENLEKVVIEITEEELDCAICKITNIFTFARAISKFKKGGSMNRAKREASMSGNSVSSAASYDDDGGGDGHAGVENALREGLENPDSQHDSVLVESPSSDTVELPTLAEADGHGDSGSERALRRTKTEPPGQKGSGLFSDPAHTCDSPPSGSSTPERQTDEDASCADSEALAHRLAEVVLQEGGGNNAWKSKDAHAGRKKRVSILMSSETGEIHTSRLHHNDGSLDSNNRPARKPTEHRAPPKVLDQETVESPKSENIPTPPGASDAYVAAARDEELIGDPLQLDAVREKEKEEAEGNSEEQSAGQKQQHQVNGGEPARRLEMHGDPRGG